MDTEAAKLQHFTTLFLDFGLIVLTRQKKRPKDHGMDMELINAIGWLAALLAGATFASTSMIQLRLIVMASCVCFAIYAVLLQLWPLLAINLVLIPVNIYRIWQIRALSRVVTHVKEDIAEPDYSVTMAYGLKKEMPADSVIFEKGDQVDGLYYLAEGSVIVEGQNVTLSAGVIFGEMAFFTGTETRTATVRCVEDSVLYKLNKRAFATLQYEDPNFGMALMSTITKRLIASAAQSESEQA